MHYTFNLHREARITKLKKSLNILVLTSILVLSIASNVFADGPDPVKRGGPVPIGYVTAPDVIRYLSTCFLKMFA